MPTFDLDASLAASPQWGEVEAQMQAEGQSDFSISAAQAAFISSFKEMNTQRGIDPALAIDTAKKFVMGDRTMAGALDTVQGLVSIASEHAPPEEVVQQFTAVIVGAAVAAGSISAGVGAMIAVGVEVTVEILGALGLFSHTPGETICGRTFTPKPDWVVGCVGMYGERVPGPKNLGWRKFPEEGNPTDVDWFSDVGSRFSADPNADPIWGRQHKIGAAFPAYWRLQRDLSVEPDGPFRDFLRAFYTAWKSNNEYALNGLKASADWQILLHALNLWNRTHSPSTTRTVSMSHSDNDENISYLSELVRNIRKFSGNPDTDAPHEVVVVNTGDMLPAVPPKFVPNLHHLLTGVRSLSELSDVQLQEQYNLAVSGKMVAIHALTPARNASLIGIIATEQRKRAAQRQRVFSSALSGVLHSSRAVRPPFFIRLLQAFGFHPKGY